MLIFLFETTEKQDVGSFTLYFGDKRKDGQKSVLFLHLLRAMRSPPYEEAARSKFDTLIKPSQRFFSKNAFICASGR